MNFTWLRSASCGALVLSAGAFLLTACSRIAGRPGPGPEVLRPDEVLDFSTLYRSNCSACHGKNGRNGAAISLANPVYVAIAGEDNLHATVAHGVKGKLMPAFAKSSGGMLTDRQIDVLVHGMMREWSKPNLLADQNAPPYAVRLSGDVAQGQQAFEEFCARCHGAGGEGSWSDGKNGAEKIG